MRVYFNMISSILSLVLTLRSRFWGLTPLSVVGALGAGADVYRGMSKEIGRYGQEASLVSGKH